MNNIIFSVDALDDVRYIFQYTYETFGDTQTISYRNKMEIAISKIANMPSIGHKRKDIPLDTLAYVFGKHTIIYEIFEENKLVNILRILHSQMDFNEVF